MNSFQQAVEFYKSIGRSIWNNISFKDLGWKILVWIILLMLVNYFPITADYITWWILQKIINIILIIDIILIVWKIIHSIYTYNVNVFAIEEDKKNFKKNQISYIKQSLLWFIQIGLWWFIVSFVFYSIEIILWGAIPAINLFWLWFVAIILFTIMCLDANIIIISNLMNKYKKAYIINYILFPIIFLLMIILYLHIIY